MNVSSNLLRVLHLNTKCTSDVLLIFQRLHACMYTVTSYVQKYTSCFTIGKPFC